MRSVCFFLVSLLLHLRHLVASLSDAVAVEFIKLCLTHIETIKGERRGRELGHVVEGGADKCRG